MTRFDLRRLRLRAGEEYRDELRIALEPYMLGGERYLPIPHEVVAELRVGQATSGQVYTLRFAARLHGPCMRCLRDAVEEVRVDAREYQDAAAGGDEELESEYVADEHLDLSAWARDEVALALPAQILCTPDCAGVCPVCGRNLNEEPHVHEDAPVDPRWASLERLRDEL
jgi:uncharacterized protein